MTRGVWGWTLVVVQFALLGLLVLVPRGELNPQRILLGSPVLLAAIGLGLWASARLGSALTPTPVPIPGAGLRTDGPYRFVRHPIYSAVLLAGLAYTIAAGSWWTCLVLAVLGLFFLAKSRWEDSLLRDAYTSSWEPWAATTGGLVPRLHPRSSRHSCGPVRPWARHGAGRMASPQASSSPPGCGTTEWALWWLNSRTSTTDSSTPPRSAGFRRCPPT